MPNAKTIVTMELKASGIAATARDTANIKDSTKARPRIRSIVKMAKQMIVIPNANFSPN